MRFFSRRSLIQVLVLALTFFIPALPASAAPACVLNGSNATLTDFSFSNLPLTPQGPNGVNTIGGVPITADCEIPLSGFWLRHVYNGEILQVGGSGSSTGLLLGASDVVDYSGRVAFLATKGKTFVAGDTYKIEYFTGASAPNPSDTPVHTIVVMGDGVSSSSTPAVDPMPTKYAGPEFSSLSLKPVMHGSSTTLTGKRLSQVSSIEIGGKAATFAATSDTELSLTPAADLAPGTYDLVIHSSAGKLTHINAVRVQPALRPFSITTRSEGRITESQYYEHSLIASMQQPELTKARCIVNGSNLALAKAQAERLCALVRAANPNIETTVIEPRSTVKNSTVFARVSYGWN